MSRRLHIAYRIASFVYLIIAAGLVYGAIDAFAKSTPTFVHLDAILAFAIAVGATYSLLARNQWPGPAVATVLTLVAAGIQFLIATQAAESYWSATGRWAIGILVIAVLAVGYFWPPDQSLHPQTNPQPTQPPVQRSTDG